MTITAVKTVINPYPEAWCVVVVPFSLDDTQCEIIGPCSSERQVEKCDRGVNINLNHDDYFTVVLEPGEKYERSNE